jgi:organic hydroperoxide reductase OsmC/OhrA
MNDYKIRIKSKKFKYKTDIKLNDHGEGIIESADRTSIKLSAPVEFGGLPGHWTPEDLLVASVNACLMTTFLFFTKKRGFKFKSYESSVEGTIELVDMKYKFTEIKIMPKVIVKSKEDIEEAEKLLIISKKSCLISNSLKAKVILESDIEVVS